MAVPRSRNSAVHVHEGEKVPVCEGGMMRLVDSQGRGFRREELEVFVFGSKIKHY